MSRRLRLFHRGLLGLLASAGHSFSNDLSLPAASSFSGGPQIMNQAANAPSGSSVTIGVSDQGSGGNWVKKRTWVKFGQALCDQIDADIVAIEKGRTALHELFTKIDQRIDQFYRDRGVTRGEFGGVISHLYRDISEYAAERTKEFSARHEEDDAPINYFIFEKAALEKEVSQLKLQVEQFSLDVAEVSHLDSSLQERMALADTSLAEVREQVKKAKELNKKLWDVLDDQVARDMYYELKDVIAAHVTAVKAFITQTLPENVVAIEATLNEHIRLMETLIKSLEQRGLSLTHRSELLKRHRVLRATEVAASDETPESGESEEVFDSSSQEVQEKNQVSDPAAFEQEQLEQVAQPRRSRVASKTPQSLILSWWNTITTTVDAGIRAVVSMFS